MLKKSFYVKPKNPNFSKLTDGELVQDISVGGLTGRVKEVDNKKKLVWVYEIKRPGWISAYHFNNLRVRTTSKSMNNKNKR